METQTVLIFGEVCVFLLSNNESEVQQMNFGMYCLFKNRVILNPLTLYFESGVACSNLRKPVYYRDNAVVLLDRTVFDGIKADYQQALDKLTNIGKIVGCEYSEITDFACEIFFGGEWVSMETVMFDEMCQKYEKIAKKIAHFKGILKTN